jgi:hypothetical protein
MTLTYGATWPIDPAYPTAQLIARAGRDLVDLLDDAHLAAVGEAAWWRGAGRLTARVPVVVEVGDGRPDGSREAWLYDLWDPWCK